MANLRINKALSKLIFDELSVLQKKLVAKIGMMNEIPKRIAPTELSFCEELISTNIPLLKELWENSASF